VWWERIRVLLDVGGVFGFALPELPLGGAGGITVVGGGAEGFLFLVVLCEGEGEWD
jgi:hypothetical protein